MISLTGTGDEDNLLRIMGIYMARIQAMSKLSRLCRYSSGEAIFCFIWSWQEFD